MTDSKSKTRVQVEPAKARPDAEAVRPLVDIYELLTMLPGQAREYSRQEFAHDIYLLHRSGKTCTRSGAEIGFSLFTGRGKPSKVLAAIDEAGERKPYYAIYFTQSKKR